MKKRRNESIDGYADNEIKVCKRDGARYEGESVVFSFIYAAGFIASEASKKIWASCKVTRQCSTRW